MTLKPPRPTATNVPIPIASRISGMTIRRGTRNAPSPMLSPASCISQALPSTTSNAVAVNTSGMRVRATAEVVRVDGRTVHLKVSAHDERELIGEGTHERVVVNVARFDKRVQEKLTSRGS